VLVQFVTDQTSRISVTLVCLSKDIGLKPHWCLLKFVTSDRHVHVWTQDALSLGVVLRVSLIVPLDV
jgi:hypothetical protein